MPDDITATTAAPKKAQVLVTRLVSTVALLAMIGVALQLKLDWPWFLVISGFSLLSTWEYSRLMRSDEGARCHGIFLIVLSLVYWGIVAWQTLSLRREPPWKTDAITLLVAVQGAFFVTFFQQLDGERTLRRVLGTVFGFVYTAMSLGCGAKILFLTGAPSGQHLVLTVILIVKCGDMGAYAFGTWLGRHKMVPHISPAKSWEGFGGAIVSSCAALALVLTFAGDKITPVTWSNAFIFAPLLCVVGVAGDLAESILKRSHGIKDSGHALPGIGGILDLTDSLLFTAPVAYFYLKSIA